MHVYGGTIEALQFSLFWIVMLSVHKWQHDWLEHMWRI